MRYMYILLSKTLGKTLQQCPESGLPSRERAGSDIPSNTRRGSREDQRPSPPLLVDFVGLECLDNALRESKYAFVCVTASASSGVVSRKGFQMPCVGGQRGWAGLGDGHGSE